MEGETQNGLGVEVPLNQHDGNNIELVQEQDGDADPEQPMIVNTASPKLRSASATPPAPPSRQKKFAVAITSIAVFAGLIVGLASIDGGKPQSSAISSGKGQDSDSSGSGSDDPVTTSIPASSISQLPYFDQSVIGGYPGSDGCQDLESDLMQAVELMNNITIDNYASMMDSYRPYPSVCRGGSFGCMEIMRDTFQDTDTEDRVFTTTEFQADAPEMVADSPDVQFTTNEAASAGGEDNYGTNNQVKGVDEADFVKSDGTYVFAAYNDRVVVWSADEGTLLSDTKIPTADENGIDICSGDFDATSTCYSYEYNYWFRKRKNRDLSFIPIPTNPIKIESLMITEERLVVIASTTYSIQNDKPTLKNGRNTRVFIYDISPGGMPSDGLPLSLLSRKDLQGTYKTGRTIGSNAHIVASSTLDTAHHLDNHLSPWSNRIFYGMNATEYRAKALEVGKEKAATFVSNLSSELVELFGGDDDCSKVTKIAIMLKENVNNDSSDTRVLPSFTDSSVLKSLTQVHSFNILQDVSPPPVQDVSSPVSIATKRSSEILSAKSSGVFLPTASYTTNVYASAEKLVIAGEAYSQDDTGDWNERTVFLVYGLNDDSSTPLAVGDVPGSLLNQFSMDHYKDGTGDFLRVATTSWGKWGMVNGTWGQVEVSESQISVLKIPDSDSESAALEMVGNATGIGLGERIYAARFYGTKAYVVTFRQVDPFYTVDMLDPRDPKVVGELKIPGFSNYLHPVSDTLILALGQNATEQGRASGLQISLFDVSDFSKPERINQYVENAKYSSSSAQYDHRAFRYLPLSKLLILPLTYRSEEYFDGFVVYDVDESNPFSKKFNISHASGKSESFRYCFGDSNKLASRSLVFDGNVMTLKGQSVLSYSLEDETKNWDLKLDKDEAFCF